MRFSERIGKKQVRIKLQTDGMDKPLRNRLWNVVDSFILSKIYDDRFGTTLSDSSDHLVRTIWHFFFKWPFDQIPCYAFDVRTKINDWFFKSEWYEVYDFLEFVISLENVDEEKFKDTCNGVLETERSGYRFVGKKLTPIVDDIEIREVEQAAEGCSLHGLEGARKHLGSALEKLSDRQNPDYRNSIKESISAIESVCVIISGEPKATLGQALKKIKDSVGLHPALEKGFSSIYGYTSDEGGIRHAMIEDNPCDFDDAKYMLVSCSAFVNYLIMKASKAGLVNQD
jgi:hypothetical protein